MDDRPSSFSEEELYCVCRKPYAVGEFMIECDKCHDWFHGICVGIEEYQAQDIDIYHCPSCQMIFGPLVLKKRRNTQRHNYKELNDGIRLIQAGTIAFIRQLKARKFTESVADVLITLKDGHSLTTQFLLDCGFSKPILVKKKSGLGLKVPDNNFTVFDVEQHVGSLVEIHVIDVSKQEDLRMKMREWTEYYNCPVRTKALNVISLEFSKTELSKLVDAPEIVRKVSWVENVWPKSVSEEDPHSMPYVQKYCLMGVKDSYTDFHIDFGGTSVWYHVLRGEKVFYIIEPSDENLTAYKRWVTSAEQSQVFFGDKVKKCYKCTVKQGQTLFIPTGWIHAVLTPIDSLVFGGNFLHSYSIGPQLRIYELEKVLSTPIKFLFPNYETTCWYAARAILRKMKDVHLEGRKVPALLLVGVKDLVNALKRWTSRKEEFVKFHKFQVPEEINFSKLIKAIEKEIKNDEKVRGTSLESSRPFELVVSEDDSSDKGDKKTVLKLKLNMTDSSSVPETASKEAQGSPTKRENQKRKSKKDDGKGLKVTINKQGLSKPEIKKVKQKNVSPKKERKKSLKVKVSNGKIVSDTGEAPVSNDQFQPFVKSPEKIKEEEDKLRLRVIGSEITYQHIPGMNLAPTTGGTITTKGAFGPSEPHDYSQLSGQMRFQPQASMESFVTAPNIMDEIEAAKKQLFIDGGENKALYFSGKHEQSPELDITKGLNNSDPDNLSDDEYRITKPLPKPKGATRKRNQSDSDSEYDPLEDSLYQDANYVYPRLDLSSDFDEDDFSWKPGQRNTKKKPKKEKPMTQKSKLNSPQSPSGFVNPFFREQAKGLTLMQPVKPKPKSMSMPHGCHSGPAAQGQHQGFKKEKPKKGLATAKQRLGKLLKMEKMGNRYVR